MVMFSFYFSNLLLTYSFSYAYVGWKNTIELDEDSFLAERAGSSCFFDVIVEMACMNNIVSQLNMFYDTGKPFLFLTLLGSITTKNIQEILTDRGAHLHIYCGNGTFLLDGKFISLPAVWIAGNFPDIKVIIYN